MPLHIFSETLRSACGCLARWAHADFHALLWLQSVWFAPVRCISYNPAVREDLERILIDRKQIAARIAELGRELTAEFDSFDAGSQVVIVPVLTGSIIFVADLMRELSHKVQLDVVTVSSYPGKSTTSQGPKLVGLKPRQVKDRHVLIVDDILDSGQTLTLIREEYEKAGACSVRACVLLRKQREAAMRTTCEYVGFDIPDAFVVGYGLDYDHYYRNLPDIGVLKPEAM